MKSGRIKMPLAFPRTLFGAESPTLSIKIWPLSLSKSTTSGNLIKLEVHYLPTSVSKLGPLTENEYFLFFQIIFLLEGGSAIVS